MNSPRRIVRPKDVPRHAKNHMTTTEIHWHADREGYSVTAIEFRALGSPQILDYYEAGNHSFDSQQDAPQDTALPRRVLRRFAKQTARQMAKELGVKCYHIFEDIA